MTRYKSAVQKRNAAVLLRKPGRLASQYAGCSQVSFKHEKQYFDGFVYLTYLVLNYY